MAKSQKPNVPDPKVAQEFRDNTFGYHSPDLQRVLALFRGQDMAEKYVLICLEPHAKWMLGQLSGVRGQKIKTFDNAVFSSLEEAEWHVFRLRWKQHFGEDLPD